MAASHFDLASAEACAWESASRLFFSARSASHFSASARFSSLDIELNAESPFL